MAGIGFLLRSLAKQNNLLGLVQAYVTSALASTGPWLLTIIALGCIMMIGNHTDSITDLQNFRVIIIYNFSFSLIMSAPVCMIATRYIADKIHEKDVSSIAAVMLTSLVIITLTQMPVVGAFYFLVAHMPNEVALMAVINFLLISTVWLTSVFITALKNYTAISWAFLIGMLAAVIFSTILSHYYGALGMLIGFSIGMCFIAALLAARIFIEYPEPVVSPLPFIGYFKKYWEIALGGIIYNMAIWIDKWLMWFAPEAEKTASGMLMYPNYDSAMFLAYLTIVPSLAMFLFSIETNFSEHYLRFYRDIHRKATFKQIQHNHYQMVGAIFKSSGNFLILQGSISVMAIMVAPKILSLIGNSYQQISIFRYGVLGALFHALTIFLLMLLSYFDNRKATFLIQIFFLTANGLLSWITLQAGFSYYGYGYFLSTLLTFIVVMLVTARYIMKLPYHTFITTNASVMVV